MGIGVFTDKQHQPAVDEILEVVGSKRLMWEDLIQYVSENYRVYGELRYYGKNYGWAMRFRKGGKALLSLYPKQNGFTAQVVLSEPDIQQALLLELGKNSLQAIEAAHPYPEGRWLFIEIQSNKDIDDLKRLLGFKVRPIKQ